MESSISCPLCSQPGFPNVNSLWLNLIRAATSQLACPVCEEVLCGLDKLTIHLMSHSLRDQISSTCFTSNTSSSPAMPSRGLESHMPHGSIMALPPAYQHSVRGNTPGPSYVVINFPSLQNVASESGGQFIPTQYPNAIENEQTINSSSSMKQEGLALSDSKIKDGNSSPSSTIVRESRNQTSDMINPVKFVNNSNSLSGNEGVYSESPSPIKIEGKSNISEKLQSKGSNSSVCKELKPHYTSLSSAFCESESNSKVTCGNLMPGTIGSMIRCQVCGLTFKDNNIALLHQQLIHNFCAGEDSEYQLAPNNDDRVPSPKQSPTRTKRGSIASQSRDAANPLHRFPCHICNKVFRMRGSLMVHLRVAHSASGAVDLASRLKKSPLSIIPQLGEDVSCTALQNLSLKETNASESAKELDLFGNVVKKMNEYTQFGVSNCMPTNSSSTIVHNQAFSVVNESQKKSNEQCSNKSSALRMTAPSSLHQCPVAPVIPMESIGIFPCAHCNKTFCKEVLLSQHLKSHDSKQWECDVCLKSFTTKYFLKKHKRLHTGEMPYTCGICSKSFTFQQSYHKHLLYHSDEKPHSCAECGRAFKELSTLHNHQRIHTGEKPWACESCGKCFRQRVSYLVHRRIHTGAMPYQCTLCLKSFRYKVSQRTHKCVAQPVNDAVSPPSDLLHLLLQSPSKNKSKIGVSSTTLEGSFENSVVTMKEQLNLHAKHGLTSSICFSSFPDCHVPTESKSIGLSPSSSCKDRNSVETILQQQSTESAALRSDPQTSNYEFVSLPPHSSRVETASKINISKSESDLNPERNPISSFDPENIVPAYSSSCTQSTPHPSTADFNMDLFQDILSMVMSPTSASAHSPSAQMGQLSLVEDQSDNDLESGLELRQLLYGPCDSESPP